MLIAVAFVFGLVVLAFVALVPFFVLLVAGEGVLKAIPYGRALRFLLLMFKNLRRNLLRTSLTYLATFVLVVVLTMVLSVLYYLDNFAKEKSKPSKLLVQQKWIGAGGGMPFHYAASMEQGAVRRAEDARPKDSMTWQFYMGTVDPTKLTRESLVPCIAMEPRKCLTIMDDLWDDITTDEGKHRRKLTPEQQKAFEDLVAEMEDTKNGIVMSTFLLQTLKKTVGDQFKLTGVNFKDLDLDVKILGEFPGGRFAGLAVINRDYLNDSLAVYPKTHSGAKHPLADKSLTWVWLQVAERGDVDRLIDQVNESPLYQSPAVKCETLAAGMAAILDSYRDLIWGMRWLLSPFILFIMTLVLANAISISVRERRMELAVLKVLGYRPGQILMLVLGEAVLIGAISGLLSAGITYVMINHVLSSNGVFEIGILVPHWGLFWGPVCGALAALAGSLLPALSSCWVKVSDVFAKVA